MTSSSFRSRLIETLTSRGLTAVPRGDVVQVGRARITFLDEAEPGKIGPLEVLLPVGLSQAVLLRQKAGLEGRAETERLGPYRTRLLIAESPDGDDQSEFVNSLASLVSVESNATMSGVGDEPSRRQGAPSEVPGAITASTIDAADGSAPSERQATEQATVLDEAAWAGPSSSIGRHVEELSGRQVAAYGANPLLVDEHANIERATAQGGYGRRQIYELVQNGADALIDHASGVIHVLLTEDALYCANEGSPVDGEGVDAILMSHLSVKRGTEIGRFGLGFKSVLGITARPQFLSRSGSFAFDADESAQRIRPVAPQAERLPVLRLAHPIDPAIAAKADPVLKKLMGWATTVVKLPVDREDVEWLHDDIRAFPAEFLLFSPHVGRLVLEDEVSASVRSIDVSTEAGVTTLREGTAASRWSVFSVEHRPTDDARKDAGELVDREVLPVIWAVPRDARRERGQFWAFFPTEYRTTLSGILNAPWKTNEDRQNLLTGPFNEELLDVCAGIVVDHLSELIEREDPGRLLDLIPARGREAPQWADERLTERVYDLALHRPSVPDQDGNLRRPSELRLHPAGTSRETLDAWASHPGRPVDWAHPSVESRERRPRVERLMADQSESYVTWLESLVSEPIPEHSAKAILVAGRLLGELPPHRHGELSSAAIVLAADGALKRLRQSSVFTSLHGSREANVAYVHPELEGDEAVLAVLRSVGIGPADRTAEFASYLQKVDLSRIEWDEFWKLASLPTPDTAASLIRQRVRPSELRVRVLGGRFEPLVRSLLPGPIVPSDGSRDADVTIDISYHEATIALLESLGATAAPRPHTGSTDEPWFSAYEEASRDEYFRAESVAGLRRQPAWGYVEFEAAPFPGPIEPLEHLSPEANAIYGAALMELEPAPARWKMGHATVAHYPAVDVAGPVTWALGQFGQLRTSLGIRPSDEAVGPELRGYASFLPVAECTDAWAEALQLPRAADELDAETWETALTLAQERGTDEEIGALYGAASRFLPRPKKIRARTGDAIELLPAGEVCATGDRPRYETLIEAQIPVVLAPNDEDAEALRTNWGLRADEDVVESAVDAIPLVDELPLVDEFPGLKYHLGALARGLVLVRCSEIWATVSTGTSSRRTAQEFRADGGKIYWKDSLGDRALLERVRAFLGLELSDEDLDDILENKRTDQQRKLLAAVRSEVDPARKLLLVLGAERIRRRLPDSLIAAVVEAHGEIEDHDLAKLAETVFGLDVWREFRQDLEELGLQPPSQWAGSRAARAFVRDLGLPLQYAGFEETKRDPLWVAEGPAVLPPLHGYQEAITERISTLLAAPLRRGLLSLPTGAGKTLVAVEALVEAMRDGRLSSPLLWIAQTDELCEQAVQTWAYVWRAMGPLQRLSISRLWGKNEAEPADGHQLVVATTAKVLNCVGDEAYDWLASASIVVVDEAHSSTGTSYTRVFQWLGLSGRERARDRCPLIGLTATPFRGTSEEETERLVARYNRNRLDQGVLGDDPYAELQRMGVLSKVQHRLLAGSTIELTGPELEEARKLRQLPARVDQLLAGDKSRNEAIIRAVGDLDPSWPVLLFAASVAHAEALAAIFMLDGIPSAVVSAKTNPGTRRHIVSEFRGGRIRVLTNYGVLAEGFDAPAVQVVIVARPTYSPNAYQQMIGRGLRGPLNGGTPECLIVNVKDNVLNFGVELAFTEFQYLWEQREA